jgi:MULE transposase domain
MSPWLLWYVYPSNCENQETHILYKTYSGTKAAHFENDWPADAPSAPSVRVKHLSAEPLSIVTKLEPLDDPLPPLKSSPSNPSFPLKVEPDMLGACHVPAARDDSIIDLTESSPELKKPTLPLHHKQPASSITVLDSEDEGDVTVKDEPFRVSPSISPSRPQPRQPVSVITISDSEDGAKRVDDVKPIRLAVDSETKPNTTLQVLPARIEVGTTFSSVRDAKEALFALEEEKGFRWRVGQSKRSADGSKKKVTLRCRSYYHHDPTHSSTIDPSDHRNGKSIKTGCQARANLNRISPTLWNVTLIDTHHNHGRELPPGACAPRRPTKEQKDVVSEFASGTGAATNFSRSQISKILSSQFPLEPLEARQISNLINSSRSEANIAIKALGGDVATVLARLQELKDEDPGWQYEIQLDENQRLVSLWWQSPTQADLCRRYSDLLLNDDTYNRNQYAYPLSIGIGIDNLGHSRNLWYCFHETEEIDTHSWILRNHLRTAGSHPESFFSDRHRSLIRACEIVMPTTYHVYCLHHLNGNIATNLRPVLGPRWTPFTTSFWEVYRSPSPHVFDEGWNALLVLYPDAAAYLAELYECRQKWAWAWIGTIFTAGIRTSGRVEGENRVVKGITGPKTTILEAFNSLNERTSKQTVQEMIDVRQVCLHSRSSFSGTH